MEAQNHFFNRKAAFAAGFLSSVVLLVTLIVIQDVNRRRELAMQKATGLGAVAGGEAAIGWDPISLWQRRQLVDYVIPLELKPVAYLRASAPSPGEAKVIRTGSLWLVVEDVAGTAEQVSALAQQFGGFTAKAQTNTRDGADQSVVTVRVPSAMFDAARARLRTLGVKVEGERIDTEDVSKQFVDYQASLTNARAEEQQYVALLRRAGTVEDVIEVTEKLTAVRTRIDRLTGEFRELAGRVEMSAIEVNLRRAAPLSEPLQWRPVARLRGALRDGVELVGDYVAAMLAIAVRVPAAILWLVTLFYAAVWGWRAVRWLWERTLPPMYRSGSGSAPPGNPTG